MVDKEKLEQVGHVLEKYDKKDNKKKKRCPVCGVEVSSELKFCPNCNHVFSE